MPKHFEKLGWRILKDVLIGLGVAVALWTAGCSHLTVAPKPVVAHAIAFDQNTQNAGVVNCDSNGCIVTPGWIGRYRMLEKEFDHTIPADDQIEVAGKNYRISYEVSNHMASLKAAQRSKP